jgi:GH15 family glucan-1,4-alpha-glucosidase
MSAAQDLELAVVGNCEVAALIDDRARVSWMCLPRLDGDPLFCALLDPTGRSGASGTFAIELEGGVDGTHRYQRNTAIVETELHDERGNAVRVTDFCPRFRARGRMFRPAMLVRLVEPLAGRPLARVRFSPTQGYGAAAVSLERGSSHLSGVVSGHAFRLTTNASLSAVVDAQPIVVDGPIAFLLGPDHTVEESPVALAQQFLADTAAYWRDWVRSLAIPAEWQDAVIRAAITLKLCTYEDTGAVVAALTTSIPEAPGSGRNWDYRFCWLRDSHFVIHALNRLGATRTMEGYLHYLDRVLLSHETGILQPVYGIGGEARLEERVEPELRGYRGMGPVRVGNHAYLQAQHDVYGAVILAVTQAFVDRRLASPGDRSLFERLERLGQHAARLYGEPDAGPWEFRGIAQVHTYSSAMCWAGCARLARIANALELPDHARQWQTLADALRGQILERAWNPQRQAFCSAWGGSELDATSLLLAELGVVDARDPRFVATLERIGEELRDGDWVYRYRHSDDFGHPETAFTVCSFWYLNALAAAGRGEEARERFERMLGRRSRLGLYSEDIAAASGELWGNLPQTYSMVGIIDSARRLSRPWEDFL